MAEYDKPVTCAACGRAGYQLNAGGRCVNAGDCREFMYRQEKARDSISSLLAAYDPNTGDDEEITVGIVDEDVTLSLPVSWAEDGEVFSKERAILYQEAIVDGDGEFALWFTLQHTHGASRLSVRARAELTDYGRWLFTIVHPSWQGRSQGTHRTALAEDYAKLVFIAKDKMRNCLEGRIVDRRISGERRLAQREAAAKGFRPLTKPVQ